MSERGVFAVDRGIWEHDAFRDQPFTDREAWMWMVGEAAFKTRTRNIGGKVVDLGRGQLVASVRFLAERWQWSKSAVDRFLDRLKKRDMIETNSGTGILVITVCKYEEYQRVSLPAGTQDGTQDGTAAGQQRDKRENTKNTKEESCADARASHTKRDYSEEFETKFWVPYPRSPTMAKKEAWREWMKLDPSSREAACKAIEPYRKFLRSKPNLETVHACRFLSQRRFEGFFETPPSVQQFDIRSSLV